MVTVAAQPGLQRRGAALVPLAGDRLALIAGTTARSHDEAIAARCGRVLRMQAGRLAVDDAERRTEHLSGGVPPWHWLQSARPSNRTTT